MVISCGEPYHVVQPAPKLIANEALRNLHNVHSVVSRSVHNPALRAALRVMAYPHPVLRRSMPNCVMSGKAIVVGPGTLGDFFDEATRRLKLGRAARRAFFSDGREIFEATDLVQGAAVLISCGETFRPRDLNPEEQAALWRELRKHMSDGAATRNGASNLTPTSSSTTMPHGDLTPSSPSSKARTPWLSEAARAVRNARHSPPGKPRHALSIPIHRNEASLVGDEHFSEERSSIPNEMSFIDEGDIPADVAAVLSGVEKAVRSIFHQYARPIGGGAATLDFVQFARFAKEYELVPDLFGMGKLRHIFRNTESSEGNNKRLSVDEWPLRLWLCAQESFRSASTDEDKMQRFLQTIGIPLLHEAEGKSDECEGVASHEKEDSPEAKFAHQT